MSSSRKIALFGGTFDPVHLGHIHLAEAARRHMKLDEVRFLPCRISPHKTGSLPSSPADRMAMLRLATGDFPWAVVDDFELRHERPSYSYQTAGAMAERFPGARLFWIMGGDQWDALPSWAEPQRLAACVEFIVFARGGVPKPRAGYVMHAINAGHPASATAIRNAITHGDGEHAWLAPPVDTYIREHRIYHQ
ncbi:MAG: nicotinate (nicotinamide) nucleotide adenylyltransferase [Luteolibacter sp.]|nr:nicotinate (nicotinamide) nucleotide adenylyltransferase [Luteolibacter sp.]